MDPFAPPDSVILALWAPSPSSQGAALLEGADSVHEVDDSASPRGLGRMELTAWFSAVRSASSSTSQGVGGALSRVVAILVSPADPAAILPGAVDAGECVIVETASGRRVALVPETLGAGRVWRAHDASAPLPPFDPGQARRDVHTATQEAITALTELDLARERPELADALTDLATAVLAPGLVPPWMEPRRRDLLERSLRLGGICELALQDDGAAATALQAQQRSQVLRPLLMAARRGVSAATEWWARRTRP